MKPFVLLPMLFLTLASCAQSERPQRIDPIWGKPVKIDPSVPPRGMHLVQILLESQSIPIKGTHCTSNSPESVDQRSLHHVLAMMLGFGLDNPRNQTLLSSECKTDQQELPSGTMLDVWGCWLTVTEGNQKGEGIATASVYFVFTKDTWKLFPKRLLCL